MPVDAKSGSQIAGYIVYRSESEHCEQTSKKCLPINRNLIHATSCVDYTARSGHTYAYRAQSVTVNTIKSGFSNEARAKAP